MTTEQILDFINQNPQFDLKGAGIQRKNVNGQFTEELALALYVSEKKSVDKIPENEIIPDKIFVTGLGWVKTDVMEGDNVIEECADCDATTFATGSRGGFIRPNRNVNRPVRGGVSISSIPSGTSTHRNTNYLGTLGFIAVDALDDSLVAVTNHHVGSFNSEIPVVGGGTSGAAGTSAHYRTIGSTKFLNSTDVYNFDQYRIEQSQKNDFAANMYYRNSSFGTAATYYPDGRYEKALTVGYLKRYMPISTSNNFLDCCVIGLNQETVTGIVSVPNAANTQSLLVDLGKNVIGTNSWQVLNHDLMNNQIYYPFATTDEINSMTGIAFRSQNTPATPNMVIAGRSTGLKGQPNNPLAVPTNASCLLQVINNNFIVNALNLQNTISNFVNCITYTWKSCTNTASSVGGDSGSAVLGRFDGIWKIVGIHFAASTSSKEGRGIRIDNIAPLLKIKPYMGQPVNNPVTGGVSNRRTLIVKNKQSVPFFTHTDGRTYYQMGTTTGTSNLNNIP